MRGLTILDGKHRGKLLRLPRRTLHVGRDPTCQIRIESSAVSRFHCRLVPRTDGRWEIADLGSRNGTFVNDVRVEGRVVLRPGDVIRIGPLGFRVPHEPPQRPGASAGASPSDVGVHGETAAGRPAESVLDEEVAAWLGTDEGDAARPDCEAESGETTIFRADRRGEAGGEGRLHRSFATLAEEAADIIARHRRLHGAPLPEADDRPPPAADAT